jgi:hypothetical protein
LIIGEEKKEDKTSPERLTEAIYNELSLGHNYQGSLIIQQLKTLVLNGINHPIISFP